MLLSLRSVSHLELPCKLLELLKRYHIPPESFENHLKSQWTWVHPYVLTESFHRFSSENFGTCRLPHCFQGFKIESSFKARPVIWVADLTLLIKQCLCLYYLVLLDN